jgi:hypothetical protein
LFEKIIMKKISISILSALVAVSTFQGAWAGTAPASCPSVQSIQSAGLLAAELGDDNTYDVGQINNYGTPDTWGFVINVTGASSIQDAMNKAKIALSTLSGAPTPIYYQGEWVCLYNSAQGYIIGAITPIPLSKALSNVVRFK